MEQVVEDCTPHKSVQAEKQVNLDSVIASLLVTMEEWGQAGWDRVVQELVLNTGRGEGFVFRDGSMVELVEVNSDYNGGPAPVAVGGFGGGSGGSEDNSASGGGRKYSGGGSCTHSKQAGGGGGSYCCGSGCKALTGGNRSDNGFITISWFSLKKAIYVLGVQS